MPPTPRLDAHAIAARLRDILRFGGAFDAAQAAGRLGVDEVALRISTDEVSPYPSIDVLAAAVESCGVDPVWLLTGEYNPAAHYNSMDTPRDQIARSIIRTLSGNELQP